jgi:phosphomethylpyrimidine synthase
MTQLENALKGEITPQMIEVAAREKLDVEVIRHGVAEGTIVIPANINHKGLKATGIGKGLSTKVNANIGTSTDFGDINSELKKCRIALEAGSDALMDLSTGGDINAVRRAILKECPIPLGTVPIYQAATKAIEDYGSIVKMTADDIFNAIEQQAAEGVDFVTVHCGVTTTAVARLKEQGRVTNVVSRGGALIIGWMANNKKENPLYEQYDRLLKIALKYDVTLSLGDGMRPGCLADATDRAQVEELLILGELVKRARKAGVQVMVEGPGHLPMDQIEANIKLQKSICQGSPFYVLGPLVTDIAAGYDHITSAIGGAIAAAAGADFLCYVTPTEHLGLPDAEDVRVGVISSRIAGHAADIAKGIPGTRDWDNKMARARGELNWEKQIKLAIDPVRARLVHEQHTSKGDACSMCGDFCAIELAKENLAAKEEGAE